MARAPEILWHFEHMPAGEPSHVQSRSVVHGLSSPRPNGDQGQSYVAGLGVGGGTGVEAGMRFHCWSFVTPSGPHDSPLIEQLQNCLTPRSLVGDAERDSRNGPIYTNRSTPDVSRHTSLA